jgi:hypothetical protein
MTTITELRPREPSAADTARADLDLLTKAQRVAEIVARMSREAGRPDLAAECEKERARFAALADEIRFGGRLQ